MEVRHSKSWQWHDVYSIHTMQNE